MPGWFVITQPLLIVAALVVLAAGLAHLVLARKRGDLDNTQRAAITTGTAILAFIVGAFLAGGSSAQAHLSLSALAVTVAALLTAETYRRRPAGAALVAVQWAVILRVLAWAALLAVIGRPIWRWVEYEFQRPLLVALLDHSKSMGLRDVPVDVVVGAIRTRAERANDEIADAKAEIEKLSQLYDVQIRSFGEESQLLPKWWIAPDAPITGLAAALRQAAASRDGGGEAPVIVLVMSDGAENAVDPLVVQQVGGELAAQRIGLVAIGVGEPGQEAGGVVIEPISVPGKIGSRDRLRVPIAARVAGCAGQTVRVALAWDALPEDARNVRAADALARIRADFDTTPPGPGLRRLTARVALPQSMGGATFERSTVVEVQDEAIRVAIVEPQPRSESAFIARALQGDARFTLTQVLRPDATSADPLLWETFDAVLLGDVPFERLQREELTSIARAVQSRGVGLLLMGGPPWFGDPRLARGDLAEICPVELGVPQPSTPQLQTFAPTKTGAAHSALSLSDGTAVTPPPASGPSSAGHARVTLDADIWRRLPPLFGSARLGGPRALAQVLATDGGSGAPLLVIQDVGRGRCMAAAWTATWPWALHSDEGLELHRRMWRQITAWLANRRPAAWIVTDQATYQTTALLAGQQRIRIRAGVSGGDVEGDATQAYSPRLVLRPSTKASSTPTGGAGASGSWEIPLSRMNGRWEAELPRGLANTSWVRAGEFELEFQVEPRAATKIGDIADRARLTARTLVTLQSTEVELQPPTSNLSLLRETAEATAGQGGFYAPITDLKTALQKLTERDPRRRIEQTRTYDPVGENAWLFLLLAALPLIGEWWIRRRIGMR